MLTELSVFSAELGHINNSHLMTVIFDRPRFDSCSDNKFGAGIFFGFLDGNICGTVQQSIKKCFKANSIQ